MRSEYSRIIFTLALFFAGFLFPCISMAERVADLPEPEGYVNDFAGVLNSSDSRMLETICRELEKSNSTELAIVTVNNLGGSSIESFAQDLFQKWGVGKREVDNGVLVLISIDDREWRVHTGYGVEGVLTDTLARRIMENEAVPEFRRGDYGKGLINASAQLRNVLEGEEYETESPVSIGHLIIPPFIIAIIGILIWLAVRISCPRCGSRVVLLSDREVLDATYSHSGIRKKEYECTVCHHKFSRMSVIPMLVTQTGKSGGGLLGTGGWGGGGGGGGGFGGFGGGSSGGGGASGGW